jgi:hypothetical protein
MLEYLRRHATGWVLLGFLGVLALLVWHRPVGTGAPGHAIGPNPAYDLPVDGAAPRQVSSGALVENARWWDGRAVLFTGEAIGEGMPRGAMAWIHLNDDAYMWKNIEEGADLGGYNSGQAVWLAAADMRRIRHFGDYLHEGDVVRVAGTFNAACRQHGGDMDIHAITLDVVQPGHPVAHVLHRARLALGLALVSLAVLLWLVRRARDRRRI